MIARLDGVGDLAFDLLSVEGRSRCCSSPSNIVAVSSNVRPVAIEPAVLVSHVGSRGSKNHKHTLGFNDEKDDEDQFNDQPYTVYDIVPPSNGSNGPRIHELIEGDCCYCY